MSGKKKNKNRKNRKKTASPPDRPRCGPDSTVLSMSVEDFAKLAETIGPEATAELLMRAPEQELSPALDLFLARILILTASETPENSFTERVRFDRVRKARDILLSLEPQFSSDPLWLFCMVSVMHDLPEYMYEAPAAAERLSAAAPGPYAAEQLRAARQIRSSSASFYPPETLPYIISYIRANFGEPMYYAVPLTGGYGDLVLRCQPDAEHPYHTLVSLGHAAAVGGNRPGDPPHELVMFFPADMELSLVQRRDRPENLLMRFFLDLKYRINKDQNASTLLTASGMPEFSALPFTEFLILPVPGASSCTLPDGLTVSMKAVVPLRKEEAALPFEELDALVRSLPRERLTAGLDRPSLIKPDAAPAGRTPRTGAARKRR